MKKMSIFKRKKNNNMVVLPDVITKKFFNIGNAYTFKDSTAFSAIDKIANSFASLDFGVYSKETREKQRSHFLYSLLKNPNIDETHFTFFNAIIKDYFDGNVFIFIAKDNYNTPVSLFRLNPSEVRVSRAVETNQKIFNYKGVQYTSNEILHVPSRYNYNGLVGQSIFEACRKTFEMSQSLDGYMQNTFSNTLGKRLVIDISQAYPNATQEQIKQIKERYISDYAGVENAGTPIIKPNGTVFETLDSGTVDNKAQQLQEQRNFQAEVIAEIFQLPIDYLTGKTNQSIETLTTMYVMNAIEPLAQQFQEAFSLLMNASDREKFYFEFDYNNLVRTSIQTRIDVLVKQITNGMLSLNEARKIENRSELKEGGDYNFLAANLMPLTEENIKAYMAKQKSINGSNNNSQSHFVGGDDKI